MDVQVNNFILCDEILLMIFKYADKYRDSIKLTCKKFYKLICELEKKKFRLNINNDIASIQNFSIINNKVIITDYSIL